MSIVRRDDRPVIVRGPQFPTLQRLVDGGNGSDAVTILINTFTSGEAVPEHTHEVEEVLLVTVGECTVTVDGRPEAARTGDAVIIKPGISHGISHNNGEPCTVVAVLASPDAQIGGGRLEAGGELGNDFRRRLSVLRERDALPGPHRERFDLPGRPDHRRRWLVTND
jgi:quercetin dioxygenase-like cupin family protein